MNKSILIVLVLLLAAACQKDEQPTDPSTASETLSISLTTPAENAVFEQGETVSISGVLSWNSTIHGYSIEVLNLSNQDSVLFEEKVHSHESHIEFSETWINNLVDTSNVLIRVTALGDHQGTISESLDRTVVCNGQ